MENIIIIGGGGHAKVVISILKKNMMYNIIGYTANDNHGELLGVKYLGNDTILEKLFKENTCRYAALGVGQINLKTNRHTIVDKILKIGFEFPSIISKDSIVNEDVEIGTGTIIFDRVVINSGSKIGNYCIINTGAIIDHDCIVGDFSHLAGGVILSGEVKVKNNSMIGSGATVIQSQVIGTNCMIGAGSVVTKDCIEQGLYVGVPAKRKG